MTEEEWGERFGEKMRKHGEDFAEEVEQIGDRINERFSERREEKKGRRIWFKCWQPFGLIWPLISSVFGLIVLIIGITLLNWLNIGLGSSFIKAIADFLSTNLMWLFLAGLFLGYAKYFAGIFGRAKWLVSPIIGSAGITFTAWIVSGLLLAINVSAKSGFIEKVATFISANLIGIFIVFLVLGYAMAIARFFFKSMFWE